jgi:transcriptional regulator with XRE-family HTH domain
MAKPRSRDPDDDPAAYLGHYLELWRLSAGFQTQEALAVRLKVARTRVTEAETGAQPPDERLLHAWLQACRIDPARLIEVTCGLARNRDQGLPTWFKDFPDVERRAHLIRCWHPVVWPGLVQTQEYARELLGLAGHAPDVVETYVQGRMERQKILEGQDAPELVVVVDISVLSRLVGTPQIMVKQCDHVLKLSKQPKTSVLVVPEGANAGCVGGLMIASVTGKPDAVLAEALEDMVTARQRTLDTARRIWERVRSETLPMRGSMAAIMEARDIWNSQ